MLLSEEKIKKLRELGLRFPIVKSNCIGCSACAIICPNIFGMNDDGISYVKQLENYENIGVEEAINACPVCAIKWNK